MARSIPIASRRQFEDVSSDDACLLFVKISHHDLVDPIRLVLDNADFVMDGETWNRSYFELELLTDDDKPPKAQFRFPNVDRQPINMLANVVDAPTVEFQLIPASYFDLTVEPRTVLPDVTVEPVYSAAALFLNDTSTTDVDVSGSLRGYDLRQESWPSLRATQDRLPGVFMR
jgi:hypothetical protein